jgi:hypothetical protein
LINEKYVLTNLRGRYCSIFEGEGGRKLLSGRNIGSWMGYLVGNTYTLLRTLIKKACELGGGARG